MNLPNALHFQIKAQKVKREHLFNKMKQNQDIMSKPFFIQNHTKMPSSEQ